MLQGEEKEKAREQDGVVHCLRSVRGVSNWEVPFLNHYNQSSIYIYFFLKNLRFHQIWLTLQSMKCPQVSVIMAILTLRH